MFYRPVWIDSPDSFGILNLFTAFGPVPKLFTAAIWKQKKAIFEKIVSAQLS